MSEPTPVTTRKMMAGSEHNLDYIVLAELPSATIGAKVVVIGHKKEGMCFGVRLRINLAENIPAGPPAGVWWAHEFPNCKWEVKASKYARTHIFVPTGVPQWNASLLLSSSENISYALIKGIIDAVGTGLTVDVKDVVSYLAGEFKAVIDASVAVFPTATLAPVSFTAGVASDLFGAKSHNVVGHGTETSNINSAAMDLASALYKIKKLKNPEKVKMTNNSNPAEADIEEECGDGDEYDGDDEK